jgi:hypothetical protein
MTTPTATALRRGGPPRVYALQLTLYGKLGTMVAREPGNDPRALVAYAERMLAEGSAMFWRLGNFPV